jgi:hypothetical protein
LWRFALFYRTPPLSIDVRGALQLLRFCAQLDSSGSSGADGNSWSGAGKAFDLSIFASMPSRDALARGDVRAHAPRQWTRVGRLKACDDGRLPVLASTALASSQQVRAGGDETDY